MEFPLEDVILQFTVVVAAALTVQLLFQRSRVPGIIGLLLLGMVIGPDALGVLPQEPVVELFGSLGLLYIMFIAGAEIDLGLVRRRKSETISYGVAAFLLSFVPAVAAGLLFGLEWPGALLLGAALSSHTLVAYPIVSAQGLAGHRPIVAATGGTLLTDTAALVVLVIVIRRQGGEDGMWFAPLLLLAGLAAAALYIVPKLARLTVQSDRNTLAEKALFLLAILLVLSVAAEEVGGENILGAFLAGVCLNRVLHANEELKNHIEFVGRMLFIPFFFIWTGTLLDVDVMTQGSGVWITAGALLAAVVFGKLAAAAITGSIFDFEWRERLLMTGITIPQAAATLAVTITAREAGLFAATLVDAVIIVIFVTCIIGPVVTERLGRRMSEEVAAPDERARGEAMHPQVDHDEEDDARR
jgi:Kef-type K+ transport system membrane component KefB